MKKITQITAFLAALMLSTGAMAIPVTFGDGGANLQGALDGITQGGPSSVDVTNDEVGNVEGMDELWQIGGSGGSVTTIVVELAGFANNNLFGIYDPVTNSRVQIFAGPDGSGTARTVSILEDGSVLLNFVDTGIDFAANLFGYYLDSSHSELGGLFYSETDRNLDELDHMAAYQGVGDMIQIPPFAAGPWGPNEYILAWEDLWGGGDRDYADFVVLVESVSPVPAPGTLVLLGMALAGLGMSRRRKA